MYTYDAEFYAYLNAGARRTATRVAGFLIDQLKIKSVADFGCGQGTWLSVWKELGAEKVRGVDGAYVDTKSLEIEENNFVAHDLTLPIDLGMRFDLVQSLEVAEHLPETKAAVFVETLCRHSDLVLFAAAVPGQGGEHHVNEQPYEYWRALFAQQGFVPFDCIRKLISEDSNFPFWYRYNLLFYVRQSLESTLPAKIREYRVSDEKLIPDIAPFSYRLRCAIVACLPASFSTAIAVAKKHVVRAARKVKFKRRPSTSENMSIDNN